MWWFGTSPCVVATISADCDRASSSWSTLHDHALLMPGVNWKISALPLWDTLYTSNNYHIHIRGIAECVRLSVLFLMHGHSFRLIWTIFGMWHSNCLQTVMWRFCRQTAWAAGCWPATVRLTELAHAAAYTSRVELLVHCKADAVSIITKCLQSFSSLRNEKCKQLWSNMH